MPRVLQTDRQGEEVVISHRKTAARESTIGKPAETHLTTTAAATIAQSPPTTIAVEYTKVPGSPPLNGIGTARRHD